MIKRKINKLDVVKLQELILKALSEEYPNDNMSPGLVCSYLPRPYNPDKIGQYYVSLCRYNNSGNKEVLFKTSNETFVDALLTICKDWLKLHNPKISKADLIKYIQEIG